MSDDWHTCHFCGDDVKDGKDSKGNRHWLSDCRPDLVEHEIGRTCTWSFRRTKITDCNICGAYEPCDTHVKIPVSTHDDCYAFQDKSAMSIKDWFFTDKHEHFYPDGPM
jgi:hypothetical protein